MTAPSILSNVSLLQTNMDTTEEPERKVYQYSKHLSVLSGGRAQKLQTETPQVLHQSKLLRRICLES